MEVKIERDNVIDLIKKTNKGIPHTADSQEAQDLFREVMEKNRLAQERIRRQRQVQNKKVLKSFKLKLF